MINLKWVINKKNLKISNLFSKFNSNILKSFSTSINTNIKNYFEEYTELRSDVKTLPTEKMRRSVLELNFGDDTYEEDPTVNKLYEKLTELFGKERALLAPTGTMANMIGLNIHATRDDYIIQGARSHLNKTESMSQNFCGFNRIISQDVDTPSENFNIEEIVNKNHFHLNPNQIKVLSFENSHNYNGGKIMNTEVIEKIIRPRIKNSSKFSHLKFHLDGSRLLNVAAAMKTDPKILTKPFDTVNICLSKGVGAPCGSILLMDNTVYQKAREIRYFLGGSMRQSGFIAAPALVAIEDWRERFESDHEKSRLLANGLSEIKGLKVPPPETNIVNIYPDEKFIKQEDLSSIVVKLEKDFKVLVHSMDNDQYIRAVVHHQVTQEKILYAIESFQKTVKNFYHL